mmetsp:Transcript_22456/g.46126  ORF Transcript_22456/g.46126 Transcript_22456/m.46126 type:complete len:277 (-) Transcript_22456:189-1019(-)
MFTLLVSLLLFSFGNAFAPARNIARRQYRTLPLQISVDAKSDFFGSIQENIAAMMNAPTSLNRASKMEEDLLKYIDVAKLEQTEIAEDAVFEAIQQIELALPTRPDLLDDASSARILDGEWELVFTVAAFKDELGKRGVGGAVNATGIAVDTTGEDVLTTQTFDVSAGRVANDIFRPVALPFGTFDARLQVSGPFTKSTASGRRADVRFDKLELEASGIKITIGWLFNLVYALRKDEKVGSSWLETTYLSETLRVGRGNKGSVFVLTRPPFASKNA